MKNTGCIFGYWREVYRKAFSVSLRPRQRRGKRSNFLWYKKVYTCLLTTGNRFFVNGVCRKLSPKAIFLNILWAGIGLVMILVFTVSGFAQSSKGMKNAGKQENADLSVMKEIEGEVSAVDKHGIAVIYDIDTVEGVEKEMYLPLDIGDIKLRYKKNLNEIQLGDRVRVSYDEETLQQGNKTETKFKAKEIIFVRPSQRKPVVSEPEIESEDTLEGALPFKGIE